MDEPSFQRTPTHRPKPRREFWVVLTILMAFLVGLPALFAWPAERVLFNPALYKQILAEQDVYDRFPLAIGEMLTGGSSPLLGGMGSQLRGSMEQTHYDSALEKIFPETWAQTQAESLIDQLFAYLNFETKQLTLVVDFRPIKANLRGAESAGVATMVVEGLPACTQEDLLRFALQALSGSTEGLPLCRPPQQLEGMVNLLVQAILNGAGETLPEQMDLMDTLRIPMAVTGSRAQASWERWFGVYRLFRQTGPWLPWVALLLVGIAGALAYGTQRGPLFWVGWALVLPGLSALMIALLLGFWSQQIVPLIISQFLGEEVFVFDLLVDVLEQVNHRYVLEVIWTSLAVAAAGAALILVWGWRNWRVGQRG